ncbi:HAD superfamily hydrolase (TIGR01509 family) [Nakamurella sp. UYEF19]|uniref:HAD family hydrolase n=1 Tax=Nakamurella sp. UYEF19 TaxID=1756392 RepID=UPI003391A549
MMSPAAGASPELRAVLFDMDGTLTDSERLWTIALDRVAAHYGGALRPETREAMVGQDMWATIGLMHRELGVDGTPEATARMLTDHTLQIFHDGLPFKDGAGELLAAVKAAGLRTALVTATYRNLVEVALDTLGHRTFDVIVCGDEVSRNKPDPEPYLRALELLGLPAQDCLVVEDSPTGSRSASLAGIGVLVVPSEIPVPEAPGLVFAETLVGIDVDRLDQIHSTLLGARV